MTDTFLSLADSLLFLLICLPALYLLLFALASLVRRTDRYSRAKNRYRYAVLIPADATLSPQEYPEDLYRVYPYRNLPETVQALDEAKYDMVVILGTFTRVSPQLLLEINNAHAAGITAMQLHHAMEIENPVVRKAHRQALTEEINYTLFRQGHTQLGFSSALNGMDIAIELPWLKKNFKGPKSNLERRLLRQNIFIEYVEQPLVYSPEPRKPTHCIKRGKALSDLPEAILTSNWDYVNKLFQRLIPSWKTEIIIVSGIAIIMSCCNWLLSLKWWILLFGLLFTVCLAIPDYLVETKKK